LKRTIIMFLFGSAGVVLLASVLVHPNGPVKATQSTEPLLAGAEIDPAVKATIENSCQSCHSEKTDWPFYSYIAPMSWLVEGDVSQARAHMNLSRWGDYSLEEKEQLLGSIGAAVRSGKMPPARYTAIHSNSSSPRRIVRGSTNGPTLSDAV
jgi:Haem-binding domain